MLAMSEPFCASLHKLTQLVAFLEFWRGTHPPLDDAIGLNQESRAIARADTRTVNAVKGRDKLQRRAAPGAVHSRSPPAQTRRSRRNAPSAARPSGEKDAQARRSMRHWQFMSVRLWHFRSITLSPGPSTPRQPGWPLGWMSTLRSPVFRMRPARARWRVSLRR